MLETPSIFRYDVVMQTTRDNPRSADNQQRRLNDRLCWLGGIIDGEGMITAVKRGSAINSYSPRISIANTNAMMITEVSSVLEAVGIDHHIQFKETREGWRDKWEIIISGFKRVGPALDILIPHIVIKRDNALALREFCNLRRNSPHRQPYGEVEDEIIARVKLGNKGNPVAPSAQRLHAGSRLTA